MATVVITGGTGLIGRALSKLLLNKNYTVIIFTRNPDDHQPDHLNLRFAKWDVDKQQIDVPTLLRADYIIHLAGEGVADKRWTKKRKVQIVKSRTASSELLVNTLKQNAHHVKVLVSASGIGWYGPDAPILPEGWEGFVESDPAADDFLGQTCLAWEKSIEPVTELGIRLVKIRTGIVFSNEGGAYVSFKRPVKLGIAGILGSGKQVLSWIHIDDITRMYVDAIENSSMRGAYNAAAPELITNKSFTAMLAQKIKGRAFITMHVPEWLLKVMLGELSVEILKSATVSDAKVRKTGFRFIYPTVEAALSQLVKS